MTNEWYISTIGKAKGTVSCCKPSQIPYFFYTKHWWRNSPTSATLCTIHDTLTAVNRYVPRYWILTDVNPLASLAALCICMPLLSSMDTLEVFSFTWTIQGFVMQECKSAHVHLDQSRPDIFSSTRILLTYSCTHIHKGLLVALRPERVTRKKSKEANFLSTFTFYLVKVPG